MNAADYGAPQLRERVIILANRLGVPNRFPKPSVSPDSYVPVGAVLHGIPDLNHKPRVLSGATLERVKLIGPGQNWTALPPELRTRSRHSGAYGRLDPNKPSRTLLTRFDSPPVGYVTHPYEHRALTVREGARIQESEQILNKEITEYRRRVTLVQNRTIRATEPQRKERALRRPPRSGAVRTKRRPRRWSA